MASFICSYDTFQITLSRSYGNADLEKDLKEMYRKAGGPKDQGVTFLFTDNEIKSEEDDEEEELPLLLNGANVMTVGFNDGDISE